MEPTTLQEAILYFADPKNCREYLVARRWPSGVECPRCGSKKVVFSDKFNRWQCGSHHERRQFTLKTGTIFEESPIGLDKWLTAMWMVVNCKNGVSSYEIARDLGITQKSAWFVLHRLREAMQDPQTGGKFGGEVEADETFVGGKAINMHRAKLNRLKTEGVNLRGASEGGKAVVMGLLERETGRARVKVVPNVRAYYVRNNVVANVEEGSRVYTDSLRSYRNLPANGFVHGFVDHTECYAVGRVHTNRLENFWSLLKRTLKGTYVSVEPFHLQAYCDEQAFRFNHRADLNDAGRFSLDVSQITGKRLTWNQVTGKEGEPRQDA